MSPVSDTGVTVIPDWVCGTCNGSGIMGVYEHVDGGTGEHLGNEDIPCPAPHVGPFLVDGRELWADPEKVRWECRLRGRTSIRSLPCSADTDDGCGFYPVGVRLEQVKENK